MFHFVGEAKEKPKNRQYRAEVGEAAAAAGDEGDGRGEEGDEASSTYIPTIHYTRVT